jgi:hypothetical protein
MLKGRHFDSSAILLCVLRYAAYGVRAEHRLAHIGFSNFEGSRDGTGRRLLVKMLNPGKFGMSHSLGWTCMGVWHGLSRDERTGTSPR